MNYTVNISPQAEADLRAIFEYIAFERRSTANAVRQIQRLEESILSLDQMPNRYRAYTKEPWRSRGLRVMPVDNYHVYFYIYFFMNGCDKRRKNVVFLSLGSLT